MSAGEAGRGAIVYRSDAGIDAIDQYSLLLLEAMRSLDFEADYVSGGLTELAEGPLRPAWVLLQYNPFRYGRWGFAPRLLADAHRLRRGHVRLALMVHEAWLDMTDWRTSVMGFWQRLQLRALLTQADAVMTSTQAIAEAIGRRAIHLPVGANIMPMGVAPTSAREAIGTERPLVVCLFGRNHPSRALGYAEAAIAAIAQAHGPTNVVLLNLGADAPMMPVPEGVRVQAPGPLTGPDLSARLWSSDLMLLPLADGLSTRRSTLMSALAHGVPVVGLSGKNTDQVLIDATGALILTPVGDQARFAQAAVELSRHPERMRSIGDAGRRLYEEEFDWPVMAARVAGVLDSLGVRRSVAR